MNDQPQGVEPKFEIRYRRTVNENENATKALLYSGLVSKELVKEHQRNWEIYKKKARAH